MSRPLYLCSRPGRSALLAFFAAAIVYAAMLAGPLAELQRLAGQPVFDLRPGGYSHDTALAILDALGPEGRHIYLTRQIPLDLVYPGLMALTLICGMLWLRTVGLPRGATRAGCTLALLAAGADYAENTGIVLMLLAKSEPAGGLVRATSMAGTVKAVATTLGWSGFLAGLVWAGLRRWRGRPSG